MRKRLIFIIGIILLMVFNTACDGKKVEEVHKEIKDTILVTDSIGREVQVPKEVNRIGCLYAVSGHIVSMLGKEENIVAVTGGLKRDILLTQMYPSILDALEPKMNGMINVEELAKSEPDVIFVSQEVASDAGQGEKFDKFHIPYLVVEFRNIEEEKYAVSMIGQVIGASDKAKEYNRYYDECIEKVSKKVMDIPHDEKVRVYHSVNEATRTDAPNTLPADWMKVTGAENVSVNEKLRFMDNKYFASLEQILLWDPEVMIVNEDGVDEYIMTNEKWKSLKAVKEGKVYKLPNGISRWGHPTSIETPLAILWTAKTLYPDHFKELDLKMETKKFYEDFFDYSLSNEDIVQILNGKGMRRPKN